MNGMLLARVIENSPLLINATLRRVVQRSRVGGFIMGWRVGGLLQSIEGVK